MFSTKSGCCNKLFVENGFGGRVGASNILRVNSKYTNIIIHFFKVITLKKWIIIFVYLLLTRRIFDAPTLPPKSLGVQLCYHFLPQWFIQWIDSQSYLYNVVYTMERFTNCTGIFLKNLLILNYMESSSVSRVCHG